MASIIPDRILRVRALQAAMVDPAPDTSLPEKTLAEQRAGRDQLRRTLRASIADIGLSELQRRFSKAVQLADVSYSETCKEWMVDVLIYTAADTILELSDELMAFPSEALIANVALVT
jgi:uncharacterized protein YjiS (DUF1127 family)